MSVSFSYFSSSSLLDNLNKNQGGLTSWLKDSYNATVGTSSDMLDLLSQLKHNAGFNPYDSIDSYITGLENTPLGNMKNDDANADGTLDDHDYYMYTSTASCLATGVQHAVNASTGAISGYTVANGSYFFANASDSSLYDAIVAGSATAGASVKACLSSGKEVQITLPATGHDYSQGIAINTKTGYIDPNKGATSLDTEVTNFMASGKIGGKAINGASTTDLVAMYKQLTTELSGLKEYTLTNQEIVDMQSEINTLNGAGVKGNYENKIKEAETELQPIFLAQLRKLAGDGYISEASDINAAIKSFDTDKDKTLNKLFGETNSSSASPSFDFINNPFYQYVVGLRTDDKLEFSKSFNEAFPDWNKSNTSVTKDKWSSATTGGADAEAKESFDPSKYSGIKDKDDRLGPTDILSKLYGTQELIALYKQYEDSQNKAKSMTLSLNVALQDSAEFDFRKVLAAKILEKINTQSPDAALGLSSQIDTATSITRGCSTGPSSLKNIGTTTPTFDGYYGDINTKAKLSNASQTGGASLVDPYEITINGTKYILGQDGDANNNIDSVSEILGISDSQSNPFASLMALDTNKDGTVSKEELIANNIILKAVDDSGKLTKATFDTSLISGIDLSKINKTQNGNTAGTFSVKLANGTTVQGAQTFDDQAYFNKLFGTVVNLKPYQTSTSSTTSSTTSTTASKTTSTTSSTSSTSSAVAAATSSTAATTTPAATESTVHKNLLAKINSAYSALIIDDTSNIETTLTNLCWKHSVSLTPAQKVKIIDSIDPLAPTYEVEAKIIKAISTLNVSA